MTSYPFITALFQSILSKSKATEGRFYVCPKMGYEINDDYLGQVIQQNTERLEKKYPLVLMMPPTMRGGYPEWYTYSITLFFFKTTYYGEGSNINPNTNTSQHSIPEDWAEMQVVALSFLRALDILQQRSYYTTYRTTIGAASMQPISSIGADRASGVRLDFELQLPYGCDPLQDYDDINEITIPS